MPDVQPALRRTVEGTRPSSTYRAILRDPEKLVPVDDGLTITVAAAQVNYSVSLVHLRAWAADVLKSASPKSWCEIFRLEEELVERIDKDVATSTT